MLKYISTEVLVNEVKDKLSTWFDSNQVDDSILYPRIRYAASKFRLEHLPQKFCMLEVENGRAVLPKGIKSICLALACNQEPSIFNSMDRYLETTHTEERHVCELNLCESSCDVCHDHCGNMYKIVQTFPRLGKSQSWTSFDLLSICRETKPMCEKDCPNLFSKSPNEIEIKNGYLYAGFEEGLIYLEYYRDLESDEFIIPDNPTTNEWIKAEMIYEVFQTLYYNGVTDILQRYRDSERNLHIKKEEARTLIKRMEVHEYYKMTNTLTQRYKMVKDNIWNDCIYSTRNLGNNSYRRI